MNNSRRSGELWEGKRRMEYSYRKGKTPGQLCPEDPSGLKFPNELRHGELSWMRSREKYIRGGKKRFPRHSVCMYAPFLWTSQGQATAHRATVQRWGCWDSFLFELTSAEREREVWRERESERERASWKVCGFLRWVSSWWPRLTVGGA